MKKLILFLFLLVVITPAIAKTEQTLDVLPLISSHSQQQNRVWVGTFQLVWNDLMDGLVHGPVKFEGETPLLLKQLNKRPFNEEQLEENSYYKVFGLVSQDLKSTIESAIMEKFNETSDILDSIDWTPGIGKYLVYAMLKKDFKFLTAFDKLQSDRFGRSASKVEYFGIDKNSDKILDDMVNVLFYNSPRDFAVSINTNGKDVLYLYRTNSNKTFDRLYSDMIVKEARYKGTSDFLSNDELKIPNINLYVKKDFEELCNQKIVGTDFIIGQAMETVDFKMDNEGVKLKSEAAIVTKMSLIHPVKKQKARKFYFDDTFVLFIQEYDKTKPYFALRVKDISVINRTGK